MNYKEFENEELKRLITMKASKINFEDVTEEDLLNIEDLVLKYKNFDGTFSNIDLTIINFFSNLRKIRIIEYEITQEFILLINRFEKLENIEFHKCKIKEVDFSNLNKNIKKIRFSNCGVLDFKYPIGEYIDIEKSEIDFKNLSFDEVKYLYIIDSIIKNGYNLDKFENIEIVNLDATKIFDKNLNLLEDIKVSNKTKYSHENELNLFN